MTPELTGGEAGTPWQTALGARPPRAAAPSWADPPARWTFTPKSRATGGRNPLKSRISASGSLRAVGPGHETDGQGSRATSAGVGLAKARHQCSR